VKTPTEQGRVSTGKWVATDPMTASGVFGGADSASQQWRLAANGTSRRPANVGRRSDVTHDAYSDRHHCNR
jgi:hypothetical protein